MLHKPCSSICLARSPDSLVRLTLLDVNLAAGEAPTHFDFSGAVYSGAVIRSGFAESPVICGGKRQACVPSRSVK